MATIKQYAYFLKGNKISIVEKDFTAVQNGQTLSAPSVDLPAGGGTWKSPKSTVADGIEIEYVYSPEYTINDTTAVDANLKKYRSDDGFLRVADTAGGGENYSSSPQSLTAGDYIVLKKAGKFNGLHKVKAVSVGHITLHTKANVGDTLIDFEETPDMYYDVNPLNNEGDTIDLPPYLIKALVYYLKAKFAEDAMNIEIKEYCMREFRKMVEKHESGKIWGSRQIMSGNNSIR